MDWNKIATCSEKKNTTNRRGWWAKWDEMRAFVIEEPWTAVGNKLPAMPAATAPFLRNIAVGKDSAFAVKSENAAEGGYSYFAPEISAILMPQTAAEHEAIDNFAKCNHIVLILQLEPIVGDGAFVVYGLELGLDVTVSEENGMATLTFKSNADNNRRETYSKYLIVGTNHATTLESIEANVIAPV